MDNTQETSLLDETTPVTTDSTESENQVLLDGTAQHNAFQVIQNKLNIEKEKADKLQKEIDELKKKLVTVQPTQPIQSTQPMKPTEPSSANNDVLNVLKTIESKFDSKLSVLTKQIENQELEQKEDQLIQILDNWGNEYGLSKSETLKFFNKVDVSGTNFENSYEGRKHYLLSLVNYPKLLCMELNKVSPSTLQEALKRKSTLNTTNINKSNSAVIRNGQYSNNLTASQQNTKVKELLEQYKANTIQPIQLKYNGKWK